MLHSVGGDLITVSEAYFDESYEDASPRIICVAGCCFSKAGALEFGRLWSRYLRSQGLPYFHANEAAHRDGIFKGWTDAEIDVVARRLVALTKEYSEFGVAVALDQDVYKDVCQGHVMFPTPYAYALTNCLYGIAHWRIDESRTGPTSFYFEQGHKHATDAHQFITFMLKGDELPGRIGYRSHAFVPKETPQVQPADLIAWLWRLHAKRAAVQDQRPPRADLLALMRPKDHFIYFERERIERFRESIMRHSAEAESIVRGVLKVEGIPDDVADVAASWMPDYRVPENARSVRVRLKKTRRDTV
jgi:hypothetical protein